jgi:2-methylcitrate dehydratase
MIRHHDNNSAGMHETDQIGGILAIGEALHLSGPEVLSALILFWEVFAALLTAQPIGDAPGNRGVWSSIDNWAHAPATAVAVGKLLGLNGDQMGNAIALSFVNHIALMVDHWNGPNSMTKSNHDAVLCRAGVFAALQAREGITGPAEPFEGEKALWDVLTGPFDLKIPARVSLQPTRPLPPGDNRYAIETLGYKRVPGDSTGTGVAQVILRNYQEYKDFAKPEDITAIEFEVNQWGDGDDPGKFDPLNSETADHSPYPACRALLDGELWEGSYALDKLTEPAVRQLMSKVSIQENPDKKGSRFTVRSKSGASVTKETGGEGQRMTHADLQKKYERICVYKGLTKEQMDKIRTTWADLRNVKDIAVPIRDTLAHYGRPKLI